MKFGLNDQEIQQIQSVFVKYPAIHTVLVFGSRAMNTFQPASDIDLALKGDINFDLLAKVKGELEELPLPYFFDVVNYHDINTTEFKEHIDRYGKIFYLQGWKEVRLGEVAEIQTGPFGSQLHEGDYVEIGTPIITVENLVNNVIKFTSGTPKVSTDDKERLKKYTLQKGDIVFSRVGSVDRCAFITEKENGWLFSGRLLRVRPKQMLSDKYTFYWMTQESIKEFVRKIAVGATMPSINTDLLSNVPISFPSLSEQRAIAAVLSSLDDKIELLREQNKTLEATAQAIFKEWFVNFNFPGANGKMVDSELGEIPEGWGVGKFEEVVDIRGGTTPCTTNPEFWDGNIAWTSPKDLSNSKEIFLLETEKRITEKGLKQIGSRLLPAGTLLLSSRAPIGYLAIINLEVAINQGYIAFLPNQYFSNYFMFLWLKLNMQEVINAANGSTFLEISKSSFRNIDCAIPNKNILEKFNEIIKPFFEKILKNIIQTQSLSVIRDALLPKLMKGEIRITK